MDEILIQEKKYISSKQAAKVTGYAKDYIGQLCREGRVPARLVGRSWYVLESALQDHRFGTPKNEAVETEGAQQSTWEPPRYETFDAEKLPIVNRLHKIEEEEEPREPSVGDDSEVAQRLQDTWRAWFDRFDTVSAEAEGASSQEPEPAAPEEPVEEVAEEQVPIRAIHHHPLQPVPTPQEFLPERTLEAEVAQSGEQNDAVAASTDDERQLVSSGIGLTMMLRVSSIVVAIISVSLAVLGSGYFDEYVISNSQVGMVAGVTLYNK